LIYILFILIVRIRFNFSIHGRRAAQYLVAIKAATCLAQIGMTSMAIAGPAHFADNCCESAKLRLLRPASLIPKLPAFSVIFCALAVAGCARDPVHREFNPARHEVRAAPVRAHRHAEPRRLAELRIRRPDPTLLAPQPAPDCEFKRADVKAVDPNEWARLKIDYERQCYQDAEKVARDRLRLLQASSTCEIDSVQHRRPAR
jgi:hypothetical protein